MRPLNLAVIGVIMAIVSVHAQQISSLPGAASGEIPLPRTVCRRAVGPITIDGDLSEPTWQLAEPVGPFYTWDGQEAGDIVDCRAVWDDEAIYFAFRCPDRNIAAVHTRRDDRLWEHDVVEVFIDPEGTLEMYVEIIVNPLNTVFDAYQITNSTRDAPEISFWDWDAKRMNTAVQVKGQAKSPEVEPVDPDLEWTVEMRIPFNTFVRGINLPPRPGDVWRIALTRYDGRDATDPVFRHYAWSPPYRLGWPHVLRRMGYLEFSSDEVGENKKPEE